MGKNKAMNPSAVGENTTGDRLADLQTDRSRDQIVDRIAQVGGAYASIYADLTKRMFAQWTDPEEAGKGQWLEDLWLTWAASTSQLIEATYLATVAIDNIERERRAR